MTSPPPLPNPSPRSGPEPEPPPRSSLRTLWIVLGVVGVVVVGVLVVQIGLVATVIPKIEHRAKLVKSKDNLNSLAKMHLALRLSTPQAEAPVDGRAFVLWPVAAGVVDPEAPGATNLFFSPADRRASPPSVAEYRALTKARLKDGTDLRSFTSYVGRHRSAVEPGSGVLLADLHFPDGALVAFADGRVDWLDREELGLGPDDPIVAGPTSPSPILRQLSE